jgi:hypothetical protein
LWPTEISFSAENVGWHVSIEGLMPADVVTQFVAAAAVQVEQETGELVQLIDIGLTPHRALRGRRRRRAGSKFGTAAWDGLPVPPDRRGRVGQRHRQRCANINIGGVPDCPGHPFACQRASAPAFLGTAIGQQRSAAEIHDRRSWSLIGDPPIPRQEPVSQTCAMQCNGKE